MLLWKAKMQNALVGSELSDIGRCCDLTWWIFQKGNISFAIHTQCTWRVMNEEHVLLRRDDIFCPASTVDRENEDFDWEIQGNNRFDELAPILKQNLPVKVSELIVTKYYDIEIRMSNNCIIQIIADATVDHEQWRFFQNHSNEPHVVCCNDCIEE